ncbi:MAG: serine--tRNA ligase, partial [Clostridiales bacterium]|nr:serine--tRNA ligase [Clostridiales bacterium]
MLDIKRIRQNPQELIDALNKRNSSIDISELLQLDEERREALGQVEALKNKRNEESKKIAQVKRQGGDASEIMEAMRKVGDEIAVLDKQVNEIDEKINYILMRLPNLPHESVPIGKDDTENVEQRRWGEPRKFEWEPKAHWDIGTDLGILDFEAAAKISGARFTVYKALGARLERAVINFFMDTHAGDGYEEVLPPYMVTRATMTGTGQLPKFE